MENASTCSPNLRGRHSQKHDKYASINGSGANPGHATFNVVKFQIIGLALQQHLDRQGWGFKFYKPAPPPHFSIRSPTMCGYCTEQMAFSLLASSSSERIGNALKKPLMAIGYLQDCSDIPFAMELMPEKLAEDGQAAGVLSCRGLEILVSQGFDSGAYQALLASSVYRTALDSQSWATEENLYVLPDC